MMLGGMLKCYWVIEMESVVFVQILFSIIFLFLFTSSCD